MPLVLFSLPYSVTSQIYNEHLPRTMSGLGPQRGSKQFLLSRNLQACEAIRLSKDNSERDREMNVEQMLLSSAAGAQRRLHPWLPGTVVWLVYPPPASPHPGPPCPPRPECGTAQRLHCLLCRLLSPGSLAWQDPNPAIAATYFLIHTVHSSPFTSLTQLTHLCHTPSASSHHCASPPRFFCLPSRHVSLGH